MIFVVYITMYKGHHMPRWYIGSSTLVKVNNGYRGSVSSKKYKDIWKIELKENPQLFTTRVLSTHSTRVEALAEELRLHTMHKVHLNAKYINLSKATVNGYFGVSLFGVDHPAYGTNRTVEQILKHKVSMQTPDSNGATPQDRANANRLKTIQSKDWKDTIGKAQIAKYFSDIDSDGNNHYDRMRIKANATLKSEEWRSTKGVESVAKQVKTRNTIQPSGLTFQQELVLKGAKTKVANSKHYNVLRDGVVIDYNLPLKSVREIYSDRLLRATRDKPLGSNASSQSYLKSRDREHLIGLYVELVSN